MYFDRPDPMTLLADLPPAEEFISEELRRDGADFVSRRRVTVHALTSPGTDLTELTGAVQCGFGIVHHPTVTVANRNGGLLVEQYRCGCRESARGRFCAHCAALLVAHYGHADARIVSDAPEEDLTGIRIRLGSHRKTGEGIYWTPEDAQRLAAPNMAIVGGADTGSTQMLRSIAIQLLRQKAQAGEPLGMLLFDGLGHCADSRSTFPEASGATVLRLQKLPFNPFSLRFLERKSQLQSNTAILFADALVSAYGLGPLQKSILVQSILAAYEKRGITSDPLTWDLPAPTFGDVYEEFCARPRNQRSDELEQVLESLSMLDLFDPDIREEAPLYDSIRGMVILDMSGCPEALKHFALELLLERLCAQMCGRERTLSRGLQKMILIDNADRLLEAGSPGLEALLQQGREYGLGVLLSAQSLDIFQTEKFDYRAWIRIWMLHNVQDLRKADLEFLLQTDIFDGALEPLYQASRRLRKLHSLIRIGSEEPVLAEDLPFYEIVADTAQSYLTEEIAQPEPEPLAGMPLLDADNLDALVNLDDLPASPMTALENL